jgi:hypothetical protein
VRVDGFASCDGSPGFNWRLSCSRAKAVASILQTSRPGVQPLPDAMLEIFANGESDQFSTSDLSPNRVVTIAIHPTHDYIPPPTPTLPQSPAGAAEAHPCTVKPDPDPATYCRPFRSTRVAELDRDERGHLVHAAAVASAQGHPVAFNLFMKYIWGGSNKVEDASAGAKAFTRSKTTEHVTKKLIEDALAMLWHDRENVFKEISQASQGQISLPVTPFQRWAVDDMRTDYALYFCLLNLPGIIAGGIGKAQTSAKNLGADTTAARNDFRDVTGHFDVDAVRHGADEFHITVIPHLHYYVVDTIDFCPGASGGWFAEWLTTSMSRWEASGISGDVTFDLEFEAPDLVGEITLKRQNGAVEAVDPSIVGP